MRVSSPCLQNGKSCPLPSSAEVEWLVRKPNSIDSVAYEIQIDWYLHLTDSPSRGNYSDPMPNGNYWSVLMDMYSTVHSLSVNGVPSPVKLEKPMTMNNLNVTIFLC